MAFNVSDRVKVTSQKSEHRGKLGTVERVDSDGNHVRLDGFQVGQTKLLTDAELSASSFSSPITYS